MIKKIIGGALVGALSAAVIYELVERLNPELIEKIKCWTGAEEDLKETEEVL